MSKTFTDTEGREWRVAIDPWLVAKVKDDTGALLTKWADDKFALPIKLRDEPWFLCDVLWSICSEQAAANGCAAKASENSTEAVREFARGLGDNTLTLALDALEGAIGDFFTSPQEKQARTILLQKAQKVNELVGMQLVEQVTAIDPAQLAKNYLATVSSSQPSEESAPLLEESHSGS